MEVGFEALEAKVESIRAERGQHAACTEAEEKLFRLVRNIQSTLRVIDVFGWQLAPVYGDTSNDPVRCFLERSLDDATLPVFITEEVNERTRDYLGQIEFRTMTETTYDALLRASRGESHRWQPWGIQDLMQRKDIS